MTYCLNQEPPQDLPIIGYRHTTDIYLFEFVGILGTIVGHSSVTSAALQCQFNRFFLDHAVVTIGFAAINACTR